MLGGSRCRLRFCSSRSKSVVVARANLSALYSKIRNCFEKEKWISGSMSGLLHQSQNPNKERVNEDAYGNYNRNLVGDADNVACKE